MNIGGIQLDRITSGAKYKAVIGKKTHPRLFYKDGSPYNNIKHYKDIILFHYTFIKPSERMKARWEMSVERGYPNEKYKFEKFMTLKWKDDKDIFNKKQAIENITGKQGFNIYKGAHPEILENHPWRNVEDIRKLIIKNKVIEK